MLHIDLFSGIGGFALATEMVWDNVEHIFCDNEPFAQAILKKHWPNSKIYGDIREIIADTNRPRLQEEGAEQQATGFAGETPYILTGGFPCQPFSQAGRRKGTADDRYLWPEMFTVIRNTKPQWVIAENVGGLVTWNNGMVLEQVCTDLESEGYEVQPFIIPAVSVNAPHRRDRVWIVAHSSNSEHRRRKGQGSETDGIQEVNREKVRTRRSSRTDKDASNPRQQHGEQGTSQKHGYSPSKRTHQAEKTQRYKYPDWSENWIEVATRLCRVDDELSYWVDGRGKRRNSRNERLKALGNAIVPAVAAQIMQAILDSDNAMRYHDSNEKETKSAHKDKTNLA